MYSTTTNMPAEDNDTDADDDAGDIDDDNMNATMTRMLLEEAYTILVLFGASTNSCPLEQE